MKILLKQPEELPEAELLALLTEGVTAWAKEDWGDDFTGLSSRTNEQESGDLLRCLRAAGLSITIAR